MEAPDSTPTVAAKNESDIDRSSNLGTVTTVSTGVYEVLYTVANTHAVEQIVITWSVVEGGNTRVHSRAMQVAETLTETFTSADRTTLQGIQTDLDNGADGLGALKTLIDTLQSSAPV